MASRALVRVPVPPGPEGPARLIPVLADALEGTGPAIAPVPVVSASVSADYVSTLLRVLHLDDGLELESVDVAVVVPTSGSTGDPRGVLLTSTNLTALTPVIQGAASPQWIAALPVTSVGGLNVLVRSLASGREPIALPGIGGAGPFRPEDFVSAVEQSPVDDIRVSLVPAQVTHLLSDTAATEALGRCSMVLVGGAGLRPSLRSVTDDLGIAVTSTYGATETGGGCVYDGRPLPGVRVSADEGSGRLTIHGPTVALGYRGEPALSRSAFGGGGFHTSDVGTVDDSGRVTVIGRADDIVTVGGVNVSPLAAERIVADHPDIAAGAVVPLVDATGDARLHAFVEIRDEAPDIEHALQMLVTGQLGRAARLVVHPVPQLPHTPHGKVDRRLLIEWAGEHPVGR